LVEAGESQKEDFSYIVRLANTDLDGNKGTVIALQSIKGVGNRVAEIVAKRAKVNRLDKIGNLPEEKIEELSKLLAAYSEYVPAWAVNRQNDAETGADMHLVGVDIELFKKDDINKMKMIRCYRGIRHEQGQKVRGQRTRSNGRTGLTLGVSRQRLAQQAKAEGGEAPSAAPAEKKTATTEKKTATTEKKTAPAEKKAAPAEKK
jgi:small subunit ribosomal protein S13